MDPDDAQQIADGVHLYMSMNKIGGVIVLPGSTPQVPAMPYAVGSFVQNPAIVNVAMFAAAGALLVKVGETELGARLCELAEEIATRMAHGEQ